MSHYQKVNVESRTQRNRRLLGAGLLAALFLQALVGFLATDYESLRARSLSLETETIVNPPPTIDGSATTLSVSTTCPARPTPLPFPGKKGVGLTVRGEGQKGSAAENIPKVIALNPYWNYGWTSRRPPEQPDHIEFVPMIWGAPSAESVERRLVNDIIPEIEAGNVKRVFGYNEPAKHDQGNVPVDEALEYWPLLEAMGVPLASPSPYNFGGSWMDTFMKGVEADCKRVDYIGVHWYGGAHAGSFKSRMRETYELYGSKRPLLITEFSPADWTAKTVEDNNWSQAQVLTFMKEVLPWMEQQDWIVGYAWFSFKPWHSAGATSSLFDEEDKELNALGRFYASVTTENPNGDQSITVSRS